MPKINPREHADGYKDQRRSVEPVDGLFHAVITKLQWQKIGAKATEKMRAIVHILHVVDAKDQKGAAAMLGQGIGVDFWFNLFKDGALNFNGQKLVNLAIACGCEAEFDPDDRDGLVKMLTGTPFALRISVTTRESGDRVFHDVNVEETKHLAAETRRKYVDRPDWKKIVGPVEERRLKDADYTPNGKAAGGKGEKRKASDEQEEAYGGSSPAPAGEGWSDDLPF